MQPAPATSGLPGSAGATGGSVSQVDAPFGYLLLALVAIVAAAYGARDGVDSWNDASRLATVEALVEHHTFAIDDTVLGEKTGDKLFIRGRFYSDKPQVLQMMLAGAYQVWRWCGGPTPSENLPLFCRVMALLCGVPAYVAAVLCLHRLGWLIGLPLSWRWLFTTSFAMATVALPYTRNLNGHLPQLAAVAALFVQLAWLTPANPTGAPVLSRRRLFLVGTFAGLAYTMDVGVGPVLLLCLAPLLLYRCRRWDLLASAFVGLLPWLVWYHAVNYAIGGTLKPANSVIEYLNFPGSVFDEASATGTWKHDLPGLVAYTVALWFGDVGFFSHNLPLFLAPPALVLGLRDRSSPWRPELWFGLAFALGCTGLYGAMSNNYSGWSLTIRWFVPLLVPGYFAVGLMLRARPVFRALFVLLSLWGCLLAVLMWLVGPYARHSWVPFLWEVQWAALATVLGWVYIRLRRRGLAPALVPAVPLTRGAQ
jgi:hypothetical protein